MAACDQVDGSGRQGSEGAALDYEDREPRRYRVSEQPRLQIGSAAGDGESALFGIVGVVRLPSGRIVVANAGTEELKVFDASGGFLASTGQYGDGPGDFRSLTRIGALGDGRIAVADRVLGRVSVFSADGVFERVYSVSPGTGGAARGIETYGFLDDGTLVGLEEVAGEGTEAHYGDYPTSALVYGAPVVRPILIDTAGHAVYFARTMRGDETLAEMRVSSEDGMMRVGGASASIPFLKSATVAVRGNSIALGHTSGVPVTVYNAQGRPRASFALEATSPREPEGVREAWVEDRISNLGDRGARREWRGRYQEFMSATPASMPAFKSLILQEGGNVWVEVFDPSADVDTPSRWIVQDPFNVGDFEDAIVELPPGFRPYDIGSEYVLGEWRDELGVEFVQMYDLIKVASNR